MNLIFERTFGFRFMEGYRWLKYIWVPIYGRLQMGEVHLEGHNYRNTRFFAILKRVLLEVIKMAMTMGNISKASLTTKNTTFNF